MRSERNVGIKLFLDSSSYAKRFIEENGSATVDSICLEADALGLSIICVPEIISALSRRLRERYLSNNEYSIAKNRLREEVRDATIINLTSTVVEHALHLLEQNALRTLDAIHVASAIAWQCDLFASSDKRQLHAAEKAGLNIQFI